MDQETTDKTMTDSPHFLKDNIKDMVNQFRKRSHRYKEIVGKPITPTTEELNKLDIEVEEKRKTRILKMEDFSVVDKEKSPETLKDFLLHYLQIPYAIHPQGKLMLFFMGIQTLAFLYNAWVIPLRICFHIYQNDENWYLWILYDYFIDFIYLFDLVFIKTRIMFLDKHGIFESNRRKTIEAYLKSKTFKLDLFSLLPLDLFYLLIGFNGRATILRLPRFLRYYNFSLFFDRLDAFLPFPVFVRLLRTINIMLYLIHINGCAYYLYSDIEGIETSSFVYDGQGNAYIRCYYIGLKTSVSIGNNPKPGRSNTSQILFMGFLWLMGIFVFAVLIGNVKDIIAQSSRKKDEYMFKFDQISQYMYNRNVPIDTINKVKQWCQFTWQTQKSFDELGILGHLPTKMRIDVALDVHYETIKNVKLFHGCDPGLIKELVIMLQPIIFLPGDYICKKGDVGKEMFIITSGQVQVVGGVDDSVVFVTLGTGVCFGEIALLGTGKMNRRTANVRAHGFTTLYLLYKEDLSRALNDYPEDKELLAKKAKKAAKEVAAKQANDDKNKISSQSSKKDVIFPNRSTPAMVKTVISIMKNNQDLFTKTLTGQIDPQQIQEASDKEILVIESEIHD